jgi:hypothetical protein
MAALLVIFADSKRPPKSLALLDLGFRKFVYLMALQSSHTGPAAAARLLGGELLAQGVALVVY